VIKDIAIEGGSPELLLAERAEGIIALLADKLRKSPWCTFEGATARWDRDSEQERSFEITRERWDIIRMRAARELLDPGTAENVCEFLWAEGLAAEVAFGFSNGRYPTLYTSPTAMVRVRVGHLGCEVSIPIESKRNAAIAAGSYRRIVNDAARALPPEWETRSMVRPSDRKTVVTTRCLGCEGQETFTASPYEMDALRSLISSSEREMLHKHALCGARHAEKIAREKVRLAQREQMERTGDFAPRFRVPIDRKSGSSGGSAFFTRFSYE